MHGQICTFALLLCAIVAVTHTEKLSAQESDKLANTCGKRSFSNPGKENKIFRGFPAKKKQWPFAAGIFLLDGKNHNKPES